MPDGRNFGWHDLGFWKVIAAEPVNLGDLAITLTLPGAEVATEYDTHKLDRPPVWYRRIWHLRKLSY